MLNLINIFYILKQALVIFGVCFVILGRFWRRRLHDRYL